MCYQVQETFRRHAYPRGYRHATRLGALVAKWRAQRNERAIARYRGIGRATYQVVRVPCNRWHILRGRLRA